MTHTVPGIMRGNHPRNASTNVCHQIHTSVRHPLMWPCRVHSIEQGCKKSRKQGSSLSWNIHLKMGMMAISSPHHQCILRVLVKGSLPQL